MNWFLELLKNNVLVSGVIAWVAAQILKTIVFAVVNKKLDLPRLVGDGGMPSSHSATVTAIATTCGLTYGLASFQFGVTVILAFIVMHDAMGVRLQTGKQAKVLNEIMDVIDSMGKDLSAEEKFKELVGHTPLQVLAGALLGIVVAVIVRY
jgi:acid phosphatase family membrane protein YuiD